MTSLDTCTGLGIMSGTSLDGIDMALCRFSDDGRNTKFRIIRACTVPYTPEFRDRLAYATDLSAIEYARLDVALGQLMAQHINRWLENSDKPDFIASHGHTIFHDPAAGLTAQIGSGAVIAARTGITTVCDFRTGDVALGGQGAPLVPIGDELLFGQYDACLNLGGFSNISYRSSGQRLAFDIAPCNMALNMLAEMLGQPFDRDGETARSGQLIPELCNKLNNLNYYRLPPPKSLGKEWFEANFRPILCQFLETQAVQDCLRSVTEHIARQIADTVPDATKTMLATGGGAHNVFLIERLKAMWGGQIVVPDSLTIDYKEALVFAFLGMLRLKGKENCLKSVTGASRNNCGGAVYVV